MKDLDIIFAGIVLGLFDGVCLRSGVVNDSVHLRHVMEFCGHISGGFSGWSLELITKMNNDMEETVVVSVIAEVYVGLWLQRTIGLAHVWCQSVDNCGFGVLVKDGVSNFVIGCVNFDSSIKKFGKHRVLNSGLASLSSKSGNEVWIGSSCFFITRQEEFEKMCSFHFPCEKADAE